MKKSMVQVLKEQSFGITDTTDAIKRSRAAIQPHLQASHDAAMKQQRSRHDGTVNVSCLFKVWI